MKSNEPIPLIPTNPPKQRKRGQQPIKLPTWYKILRLALNVASLGLITVALPIHAATREGDFDKFDF